MKENLKKTNPKLYRAKALRLAYRKLGHNLSVDEILVLMSKNICPYCDKPVESLSWSIDHKLPKNRGGSNELINLHLDFPSLNHSKNIFTCSGANV